MTEPDYTVEVRLDGKQWITLNQRLHWRVRAQRTKAWREITAWQAQAQQIPRIAKARIVAEVRCTVRRPRDPHNWQPTAKACLDGLVDAGVFIDDNDDVVTGPDMRLGKLVPAPRRALVLQIFVEVP